MAGSCVSLEGYGVTADRKSLYDDLEALRVLGIDVIGEKNGRSYSYHVGKKQFEIAELKLLVDAIQSSKFITEKKSKDLIKKLTGLASNYEASQLKRQVVVQGRIKTMNESIYYIVDDIHNAITNNKKIRFEYLRWANEEMFDDGGGFIGQKYLYNRDQDRERSLVLISFLIQISQDVGRKKLRENIVK